jgi:hypothetical protein
MTRTKNVKFRVFIASMRVFDGEQISTFLILSHVKKRISKQNYRQAKNSIEPIFTNVYE